MDKLKQLLINVTLVLAFVAIIIYLLRVILKNRNQDESKAKCYIKKMEK